MFHDRNLNNKINRIHERALRIAYKDNVSTFEKLLEMDNSVTVHQRNLQLLMFGHTGKPGPGTQRWDAKVGRKGGTQRWGL